MQHLEKNNSKQKILEFYINQVPFGGNRRGIVAAALYYYGRELDTLSISEMISLAVIVRSPANLSPSKNLKALSARGSLIAAKLIALNLIPQDFVFSIAPQTPSIQLIPARHAVMSAISHNIGSLPVIRTTINPELQKYLHGVLQQRLEELQDSDVAQGGILVVEAKTGKILGWATSNSSDFDPILTSRQPGSTLKPFLYALGLQGGMTAATLIDDSPFSASVGNGIHHFRNYSLNYHGPVTLRTALANSLNIPAVKTIREVGEAKFLALLKDLGITSLTKPASFYGEGLALGNGEISLYELVQAYTALANHGRLSILQLNKEINTTQRQVLDAKVTSIISNIISDTKARKLEFTGSTFDLPYPTAIKTGTSTDFRDSWVFAYNNNFVVGIWMGNLNGKPMHSITGTRGPGPLVRGIFNELNKIASPTKLYLHPGLIQQKICLNDHKVIKYVNIEKHDEYEPCNWYAEFFRNKTTLTPPTKSVERQNPELTQPKNGMHLAIDPRIPEKFQKYEFKINNSDRSHTYIWNVNGKIVETDQPNYLWPVAPGEFTLKTTIISATGKQTALPAVKYSVKI